MPDFKFNVILIRYGEIALKGKNRKQFEKRLAKNIKMQLKKNEIRHERILKRMGRLIIHGDKKANYSLDLIFPLVDVLGVVSFSPAIKTPAKMKKIKDVCLFIAKKNKLNSKKSFKIETQRLDKRFALTSLQLNENIGRFVQKNTKANVRLNNPDLVIGIEIIDNNAYIFDNKISGYGGLPVGIEGKVIALLSGGIDSPVAAFLAMKRGCSVIALHLYNYPFTDARQKQKAIKLFRRLRKFHPLIKMRIVPFGEIQKAISKARNTQRYRCIICRRMMFRVAEKLAKKEGAKAIVTGESLGQVASQTLDNILCEDSATKIPILRPLIGMDKIEIERIAKQIGTFDISILPSVCCRLVPKNPATKAKPNIIKKMEENINIKKLIENAISKIEMV